MRLAAICAIRNLGNKKPKFAIECQDLLFYMLNDENDQVRIQAIESLARIDEQISLGVNII